MQNMLPHNLNFHRVSSSNSSNEHSHNEEHRRSREKKPKEYFAANNSAIKRAAKEYSKQEHEAVSWFEERNLDQQYDQEHLSMPFRKIESVEESANLLENAPNLSNVENMEEQLLHESASDREEKPAFSTTALRAIDARLKANGSSIRDMIAVSNATKDVRAKLNHDNQDLLQKSISNGNLVDYLKSDYNVKVCDILPPIKTLLKHIDAALQDNGTSIRELIVANPSTDTVIELLNSRYLDVFASRKLEYHHLGDYIREVHGENITDIRPMNTAKIGQHQKHKGDQQYTKIVTAIKAKIAYSDADNGLYAAIKVYNQTHGSLRQFCRELGDSLKVSHATISTTIYQKIKQLSE
jgi:hypothetical protein